MHGLPRGDTNREADRPCQDGWEGTRWANASSERLQFLTGLEAHSLAGRDADFLAGAGISSNAGLTRADVEYAEAAQLDSLTLTQSALHGLEDGLDGLLRLGPGDASLVYHRIHYVELDHANLRFPQRQAMLDTQLRVVKLHAVYLTVIIT
jgi:hypothetical protein